MIFKKPIQSAPPRLQRILFDVIQYSPKVTYIKGTEIPIADALSRDCDVKEEKENAEEELKIQVVLSMSKNARQELIEATTRDKELQDLVQYIKYGFPEKCSDLPNHVKHYFTFREELSYYEGPIFKGEN